MSWYVHHGDCLEWLRTLDDKSVDVAIFDPPYEEECHTKARRSLKDATQKRGAVNTCEVRRICEPLEVDFGPMTEKLRTAVAFEIARIVRRWSVAFCQIEGIHLWQSAFRDAGLEWIRGGVWVKPDATPQFTGDRPGIGFESIAFAHPKGRKQWNGGGRKAVWVHTGARHEEGTMVHPTQKPLPLMLDLVRDFSNVGETVLDPFAGSGTTGVAALRLGRSFLGCEQKGDYHAIALERIAAEAQGISLQAARSGQVPMFGGG